MIFRQFPYLPFEKPIPAPPLENGGAICLQIDRKWLPYLCGLLLTLCVERTWISDADRATGEASILLDQFMLANACPISQMEQVVEGDDCMGCCLRFQNGHLQILSCGEWVDVPGQSSNEGVGTSQPGVGITPPNPNGGINDYCGALGGNDAWLLPVHVSAGDTLLFHQLLGAWRDDREIIWNCPDGWVYALGACGQTFPHGSPDPLPTGLHMALIALIDGNYYDVLGLDATGQPTVFTVPGGITDKEVLIIPNIDDKTHVNGEVSYCVTVQNNQVGSFTHIFDFKVGSGGFVPFVIPAGSGGQGIWTPGTGWQDDLWLDPAAANFAQRGIDIHRALGATRELTQIIAEYVYLGGAGGSQYQAFTDHDDGGTPYIDQNSPVPTSPHLWSGSATVSTLDVSLFCGSNHTLTDPGGSALLTKLTVTGVAVDPF